MAYRLGVDVGGTFTDFLLMNEETGETHTAKVPSTPEDSSIGVLNGVARWWFDQTQDIVPNALLSTPHPNVSVMKKCEVFPVEFVMRGFITGSTSTSLWTHYNNGEREYCGNSFPDGLRKNDQLSEPVLTPTTKAADHDEPISLEGVIERGLMSREDAEETARLAKELFKRGQEVAASKGFLLVDTKYEFGKVSAAAARRRARPAHSPTATLTDSIRRLVTGRRRNHPRGRRGAHARLEQVLAGTLVRRAPRGRGGAGKHRQG